MNKASTFVMFYSTLSAITLQYQLENVAIANALQLEAARRRAVPIRSPYPL